MKTVLVTGASRGIGKACALNFAKVGVRVFATARNKSELDQLSLMNNNIQVITSDLATQKGREQLAAEVDQLDYILHNAARLDQPKPFDELEIDEFRAQMAVNVEPVLFLTQKLLPSLNANCRILTISSGAAKRSIKGLSHYCTSKCAAWMATEMLKSELVSKSIWVNHYYPGTVDTGMQKTLRDSKKEVFEFADEFRQLHSDQKLNSPEAVAEDIIRVFTQTSDTDFQNKEWVKV